MKITLKDIAEKTGYSVSTVSRVINGSDKISTKAQEEIMKCAEELNYPASKRNRPPGKFQTPYITLVTDFHEGEFYSSYFYGFNKAANSLNVDLTLLSVKNPKQEASRAIKKLVYQGVDGVILFTPELTRSDYLNIVDEIPENFPIVSNALIESPIISTVTFDGYSGGHIAANHFEKKGYQNVGIVKGPFDKAEARYRSNGFVDYCNATDKLNLTWTYEGNFDYQTGVEAFSQFKSLENQPRAIFMSNDLMCQGFVEEAKHIGMKLPDDIAVLGYDDLPMCRHTYPQLSSVHTGFKELGIATLRALLDKIQQENTEQGMLSLIPVQLAERDSS